MNSCNHLCESDSMLTILWVILMLLAYLIIFIYQYFFHREMWFMREIDPSVNYKFSVKCFYDDKQPYYRIKISRFLKTRYTINKWTSIDDCKKAIAQLHKERINYLNNKMNANKNYLDMSIDAYELNNTLNKIMR